MNDAYVDSIIIKKLKEYVEIGRISERTAFIGDHKYAIYSYTKDQFYNYEWDNLSIYARGLIVRDDKKIINSPMPKIFNYLEHESTSKESLSLHPHFEVREKLNGHLVIISVDDEMGYVLVSTKGSLSGEFVEKAEEIVKRDKIRDTIFAKGLNYTMSFEAIVDYDKHLMYETHLEEYSLNKNALVLISATDNETNSTLSHFELVELSNVLNVPVVRRFDNLEDMTQDQLLAMKNTEGYVLVDVNSGFSYKVKTTEYIAERYKKFLTRDVFLTKFGSGGFDRLNATLDEEMYPIIAALEIDYYNFLKTQVIRPDLMDFVKDLSRREVFSNPELSFLERLVYNSGGVIDPKMLSRNKETRMSFVEYNVTPNMDSALSNYVKS